MGGRRKSHVRGHHRFRGPVHQSHQQGRNCPAPGEHHPVPFRVRRETSAGRSGPGNPFDDAPESGPGIQRGPSGSAGTDPAVPEPGTHALGSRGRQCRIPEPGGPHGPGDHRTGKSLVSGETVGRPGRPGTGGTGAPYPGFQGRAGPGVRDHFPHGPGSHRSL